MHGSDVAAKFTTFKKGMFGIIKSNEFKRSSGEYVRDFGDGYCVLRLQGHKYNSDIKKSITINVGGGSEFLWRSVPIGFNTFEKRYGVVPFGRRIGWSTNEDKWYIIQHGTNIDELIEDFRERMAKEILPFAEKFSTLRGVLNDLLSDHPSVPSRMLIDRYVEAIRKELSENSG